MAIVFGHGIHIFIPKFGPNSNFIPKTNGPLAITVCPMVQHSCTGMRPAQVFQRKIVQCKVCEGNIDLTGKLLAWSTDRASWLTRSINALSDQLLFNLQQTLELCHPSPKCKHVNRAGELRHLEKCNQLTPILLG